LVNEHDEDGIINVADDERDLGIMHACSSGTKSDGCIQHLIRESSNVENKDSGCLVGPNENKSAHGENVFGSSEFIFNAGVGGVDSRKHIKAKRRVGPKHNDQETAKHIPCSVHILNTPNEPVPKRKYADSDIEMVDSEGIQKRSCLDVDLYRGVGDSVAVVGAHQPREQQ
jgi:hypothetical protein